MKYMLYKCLACGTACNFKEEIPFSKQCPNCGKDLSFWTNFESDEELPIIKEEGNKNIESTNSELYNEIHEIKNIMGLFTAITAISIIIGIIYLLSIF